jgi:hypothetical protein
MSRLKVLLSISVRGQSPTITCSMTRRNLTSTIFHQIVLDPPNTSQHAQLNSAEPMPPGSSRTRSDVSIPYGSSPRTSTMTSDGDRRTRELSSRSTSSKDNRQGHLSLSPARVASAPSSTATALGYLEQAKGGLMTVGEKLGLS